MPIWKHVMYTSFLNCGGLSNFDFQINKRKNIAKILKGAQKHPKLYIVLCHLCIELSYQDSSTLYLTARLFQNLLRNHVTKQSLVCRFSD
jgi:prophage maintenance system killer protein